MDTCSTPNNKIRKTRIRIVVYVLIESASRPLVDFSVLNDNLIKGLISCVKCISRFLMKVQMYSLIYKMKYNYEANGTM
jgi:hypothetical protein